MSLSAGAWSRAAIGARRVGLGLAGVSLAVAACGSPGDSMPSRSSAASTTGAVRTSVTASSSEASATTTPARPLTGKVVVIDPGHNGGNSRDPVAVNRQVDAGFGQRKACNTSGTQTVAGYPEHAQVWDVSARLVRLLRAQGATVVLTRADDTGVGPCIDARGTAGQRARADAVLSLHADGTEDGSGRGFYVVHAGRMAGGPAVARRSRELAVAVRNAFGAGTGLPYARGGSGLTLRSDLGTLNLAAVPAVLVESGNMRNPADARLLSDPAFRQREAIALATGLRRFLTGV